MLDIVFFEYWKLPKLGFVNRNMFGVLGLGAVVNGIAAYWLVQNFKMYFFDMLEPISKIKVFLLK